MENLLPTSHIHTTPQSKDPNSILSDRKPDSRYWILLSINYTALFLGSISSTLLSRFYFIHGGKSRWISTWVQSAGFPILVLPIYLSSLFLSTQQPKPFSHFTPKLLFLSIVIGFFMGLNNFLISWGISYLSVSTSSLLLSSQLAFNLLLSAVLVKQKLTFSNVNCVVLLTLSSVLLALGSSHDRPEGVAKAQFFFGFVSILGAALLFALYLPVMEMVYRKVSTYRMVMEMQVVMEVAATVFSTVGMLAAGGFDEMRKESLSGFDLGSVKYWLTVGFNVVSWQLCFMGTAGIVYLTTSLTGGICMTALLPMNVVGGVWAFGDEFGGGKAVSTVLCFWGFLSYLYGEYRKKRKEGKREERERKEMEMVGPANGRQDGHNGV
ncbi:probable purine permease 4 [Magnolia sinica]|uniref:probable purine permease 4 n=1 Tax=Magnolia sinica TaxID=86752 RepID=UPI002658196E|nr:probable purine permease 4 [Magnolia sinica]